MQAIYEGVENYFVDLKEGCNNLIDCKELMQKIETEEKLFLLDIRKGQDYEKEHIEGAYHAEWPEVGDFIKEGVFREDEKIIVICYTGQSAGQIVSILKVLGYDACALKGGMMNKELKDYMPIEASCGS